MNPDDPCKRDLFIAGKLKRTLSAILKEEENSMYYLIEQTLRPVSEEEYRKSRKARVVVLNKKEWEKQKKELFGSIPKRLLHTIFISIFVTLTTQT